MLALEKRLGVCVVLSERIQKQLVDHGFDRCNLLTDLQLLCAGFRTTSHLVTQLDAALVDKKTSTILINAQVQLDDAQLHHIFVAGDVSNHPRAHGRPTTGPSSRAGSARKSSSPRSATQTPPRISPRSMQRSWYFR